MMHRSTLAVVASLALGAALAAQEPPTPSLDHKAPASETERAPDSAKSVADYIRDLASDSFRLRTQAERGLRALGKSALPELQKAAGNDADAETQWRARRLVRQIERGDAGGLLRRDRGDDQDAAPRGGLRQPGGPGPDDIQDRFDQLFRGLENDFGVDIPRARFFHDDFFHDLREQMQDLQQRMQSGAGQGQSQGMSMQMGPDGVRVEVKTRNDKGAEETKVYEAPDLQTFQQKYPGVLGQHGLGFGSGGGLRTFHFGGDGDLFRRLPQVQWGTPFGRQRIDGSGPEDDQQLQSTDEPPAILPPAGKRLGVVVKPEIPQQLRDYLGIDGGLMVEQVQDGTMASALQLEPGDIVLKIAGNKIASTKDVQAALGGVDAGTRVEVVVLRRGKELSLHTDKPHEVDAAPAPLEKRKAKDGQGTIR